MSLKYLRIKRNMTQKELSLQSGINFRSLQDYEQGHKRLSSAGGDILLRLCTVLACSLEELLLDDFSGAELLSHNKVPIHEIRSQQLYCEKYQTAGRWICSNTSVATMFYFNGQQYILPFRAIFTPEMLPSMRAAAGLQMEAKIEEILLAQQGFESW